jgi:hypothetical protein
MTWVIKVTHADEEGNQLGTQKVMSDELVILTDVDIRLMFFKEMLDQMDAKLKERNGY